MNSEQAKEFIERIAPNLKDENLREAIKEKIYSFLNGADDVSEISEKIFSSFIYLVAQNYWCPSCCSNLPKNEMVEDEIKIMKISVCCKSSSELLERKMQFAKEYLNHCDRMILSVKPIIDEESYKKILETYSAFSFNESGKTLTRAMLNGLYLIISEVGNALSDDAFSEIVNEIKNFKEAYDKNEFDKIGDIQTKLSAKITESAAKKFAEMDA